MGDKKSVSDAEWKARLSPEQYRITRQKGTERAFSGEYHDEKRDGIYRCVCCGARLFDSEQKYDSGTGWPSYWAAIQSDAVNEKPDNSFFMRRTEVVCGQCDAHLGHVFEDGPEPTGRRFCINSASLQLEPEEDQEPA